MTQKPYFSEKASGEVMPMFALVHVF